MVPAAVGAIAPRCARPSVVVVGSPTRTAWDVGGDDEGGRKGWEREERKRGREAETEARNDERGEEVRTTRASRYDGGRETRREDPSGGEEANGKGARESDSRGARGGDGRKGSKRRK